MVSKDRLALLQWTLERQLQWVSNADAKAGALVAIYIAIVAAASTALQGMTFTPLQLKLALISGFLVLPGLLYAIAVFFPRVDGPLASVFFFKGIRSYSAPDYASSIAALTEAAAIDDLVQQIYRNAEIATAKHNALRSSIGWAAACFVGSLIALLTAMAAP